MTKGVPKKQMSTMLREPKPDLVHNGPLCCTIVKHPLPTISRKVQLFSLHDFASQQP